jgi:uncharacterized protein with GYD domain
MPRYVALIDGTDQGVRGFKETLDRADMTDQIAESVGAKVVDLNWTLGEHDIVGILGAPDDVTATASSCRSADEETSARRRSAPSPATK